MPVSGHLSPHHTIMATLTEVNARTLANFTAISNSQEQKWAMKVVLESRGKHPFKVMLGGYKGGKPFIEIMDTRKMAGNTVYLRAIPRAPARKKRAATMSIPSRWA
jgi:hypothetical protein